MSVTRLFSVDSSSPLIQYTPAAQWRPLAPADDGDANQYANSSTAYVTGAFNNPPTGGQMQFTFNGTAVYLYGAKRDNHGAFTCQIDDQQAQTFSGFAPLPYIFQTPLCNFTNLANGAHTIKVVNVGGMSGSNRTDLVWWDLDWLSWEEPIPAPSGVSPSSAQAAVTETTYQMDDANLKFFPSADSWALMSYTAPAANFPSGQTRLATNDGARMSFNFTIPPGNATGGGSLAVLGQVSKSSGNMVASLTSSGQPTRSTVLSPFYNADTVHQVLLWYVDGLAPGRTWTLDLRDSAQTQSDGSMRTTLGIELIKTYTTGQGTTGGALSSSSSPSGSNGSSSTSSSSGGSNAGAIAGGVVGGIVGLLIIGGLIFFLMRRNHKSKEARHYRSGEKPDIDSELGPDSHPPPSHITAFPGANGHPTNGSSTLLNNYSQHNVNQYGMTPAQGNPAAPVTNGNTMSEYALSSSWSPPPQTATEQFHTGPAAGPRSDIGGGSESAYGGYYAASESDRSRSTNQPGFAGLGAGSQRNVANGGAALATGASSHFPRDDALKRAQLHDPNASSRENLHRNQPSTDVLSITSSAAARRERDLGSLMRADDLEEEDRQAGYSPKDVVLPPEYQHARQDWEPRRN